MSGIGQVIDAMVEYYAGDVRRINHFLKVYGFAKAIGDWKCWTKARRKQLRSQLTMILDQKQREKHNSSAGSYQQIEGQLSQNASGRVRYRSGVH
jgi:hypothetical protein